MKTHIIPTALTSLLILAAMPALAQDLVLNGNFTDPGTGAASGANWNNNGGSGSSYYNESTVGANIASIGWWSGVALWQDTTSTIQPGATYQLSASAQVGQSPVQGINLSLQDVTAGWTVLANQDFNFTSQSSGPNQWETFTLNIPASQLTSTVGDDIGVGVTLLEPDSTTYGWLWVGSVSLVQVPEPSSLALLAAGAFGFWGMFRRRTQRK